MGLDIGRLVSARDDYPLTGNTPWDESQRDAMCDEIDRLRRWKAEAIEVLTRWERDEAVARIGGTAADAYAKLRQVAIIIDRAIGETTREIELAGLRNALAFTHRAEDSIVAVLQLERVAS